MPPRSKKKDKDRSKVLTTSSAEEASADSVGQESQHLRLPVLSGVAKKPGTAHRPSALLPARELKRAGLAAGEPVLVETGSSGRRTVATCEVGGREGGVLLSASVLLSLGAAEGDEVTLTGDFEALDAGQVGIEVPSELHSAWPELARGLQLDLYLGAALDGALVTVGDTRTLCLSARPWQLRILACAGQPSPEAPGSDQGPWLITENTRLAVSTARKAASTADAGAGDVRGFSRVGGLRGVIEELTEAVQLPLERPELYRQLGIGPPRGVLLYGPPGTGKTLLAKSVSEELQCPVELLAATDLVGGGLGESEGRVKAAFERCQELAKGRGTGALLFIDEIDAVCPKRDDSSEAERRMVAAFLTALDGVKGDDGIVVLGATNRPDAIDPALRRAGRLEREIEVGVPNTEEREQILEVHLSAIRHNLSQEDRRELARRSHGYVGADLRSVCRAAARAALREAKSVDLASCVEALRLVPPSALKELLVEVPEVHWGDIGGYDGTKEALKEAVEWPIRHAWAFEAMHVDPPRGVLLYGPPGCSKTMMAKAVATETEMNFVSIKGPELFSKYVGDSEKAVREVFRKARTAAPCVVFFDEVDAIGSSREGDGAGSVSSRVLAQLLAEMDGISAVRAQRHVVVLAATNRPHVLDPALMRPGRFDRLVHVPLPDEPARAAIFEAQLSRMRTAGDLDPTALAARSVGYSGAEVVMVCREAALAAIREVLEEDEAKEGEAQEDTAREDTTSALGSALPCATQGHFEGALAAVRPRVDMDMVRFYEDFERRTRHS